jgi:tRNA threonylcarbamoyladenosine biosynthesis protein TsaE
VSSVLEFHSGSADETQAIGRELAAILPASGVVLLIGNLGAGKTTLAKGIVEGRGGAKAEEVSSPTFTLIHEYGHPVRVYHIDLYRLDNALQVAGIGLEELFDKPALVLVEWGERFRDFFPPDRVEIRIEDQGSDRRRMEVTVSPFGESAGPPPALRGQ